MANRKKKITKKSFVKEILMLAIFFTSLVSFSSFHTVDIDVRAQGAAMVEIRADGTTMVDSKPFFPFGFYHVSLGAAAGKQMNTLRDIAAAGFNTISASVDNSLDDYEKLLDEAERLGVHVLSANNSTVTIETVNAFKNKPALLGWMIQDDANVNGNPGCDEILQLHQAVKTVDPNHVTYISSSPEGQYEKLNYCSDIIAAQAYPVPSGPLDGAYYIVHDACNAAAKFNRAVYANVQSFAWPGKRGPTFDEVRNMTYQALIAGAKGIIYYTYHDDVWYLAEHPDLWKGLQSLVPEIKKLSPIVLNGDLTKIHTEGEDIFAGIWTAKNEAVVVVINTSYNSTTEVSITVPSRSVGEARPIFTGRPSGMVVKDGKLSGSIKPLDVHVYRFSL